MLEEDSYVSDTRSALRQKDAERYFRIQKSSQSSVVKLVRSARHFISWSVRLCIPDFLLGHPNLFDNLKVLRQHPQFKPLRMAFAAWMIFAISIGSTGIYTILSSKKTQAAGTFSMQTGYYLGTGVAGRSITGLGFRPELVLIKSDNAAGQLVWKSSVMPASVSTYLGVATADNTETEITLDADGFTVSAALEVNTINVNYVFIAFAGSDCTSGGVMCIGSYVGDNSSANAVPTGFQPDLVWVKRTTALVGTFRTSQMPTNEAAFFSAAVDNSTGVYFQTLDAGGSFTVGLTNNTLGGLFYFVAFKNLSLKSYVGKFTGDGSDNKNIGGVGFEPDFVLVKQNSAQVPAFNTTEMYGDYSSFTTVLTSAVNSIQSLDTDGFQVGNSANVNALGVISYYFAFGGVADPTPAGTFYMERGSYTGTGIAQSIETSFAPNLVMIKGNTTQNGVWSTSLEGDATEYFAVAGAAFTGGITGMTDAGFNIGTHATVNSDGILYEWVAYGNATSPRQGDGAADFYIGSYTGNGIDGRAIDHLGFAPSMVVVKRSNGTANQSFWRSSSMVVDTSSYFSATADITGGVIFKTLNSDGFTMGLNAGINAVGATYNWFAFKEGARFEASAYLGTGVAQDIASLSFQPDYAWTKRTTNLEAVHKSSDLGILASQSQHFLALANDTNDITDFRPNGFRVGTSGEVNTSGAGNTYNFAAWKKTTTSNPPNTPTNSSPSDGATGQDANVTLTGSAYSDPDSDPQIKARWEVDNDADFSSPVWSRISNSGEITTSVTTGNGTFANELAGKTELDHNTRYYWHVRYSDGVYSSWSTATSFVSNTVATPTNITPADQSTVTTLTPTLTASAFSDGQGGHTASSSQWELSTTNSFASPLYDSGTISYTSSHAVPNAVLSDRSAYYWRVRYEDSTGQWSEYSTPTKFIVAESLITVKPLFGSAVVDQGDGVKIDAQVKLSSGSVINNATTTINIYNPSGTKIVDTAAMSYVTGSSGIYRYAYTVPTVNGSYLYEVTAASSSKTGYGAGNFEVRTLSADVNSVKTIVGSEQTAQTIERASQSAERIAQATSRAQVTDIQSSISSLQSNLDVLIGAFIVTQSTVNDGAPTTTSFVTALTNSTNNFYNNAVLTFTGGGSHRTE